MLVIPCLLHALHTAGRIGQGRSFCSSRQTHSLQYNGENKTEESVRWGEGAPLQLPADCSKFKVITEFATSLAALPTRNPNRATRL